MFPNVHLSHRLTVEQGNHCIWLFFSTLCVNMCNLSGEWNLVSVSYACGVQMSGNRQESFKNKPHFEDGATDLGPVDIIDLQTTKGIGKASSLESPQSSTYH